MFINTPNNQLQLSLNKTLRYATSNCMINTLRQKFFSKMYNYKSRQLSQRLKTTVSNYRSTKNQNQLYKSFQIKIKQPQPLSISNAKKKRQQQRNNQLIQDRRQSKNSKHSSQHSKKTKYSELRYQQINHPFKQKLQNLKKYLSEQALQERLSSICPSKNRGGIRIYNQTFRKIFIKRYGKDRFITFMNFEYIEDFDSIYKTLTQMLNMTHNQIILIAFIIMDQDRDGLITPSDIISILSKDSNNQLVLRDCLLILRYFKRKPNVFGVIQPLLSQVTDSYITNSSLNLSKYRMIQASNKIKQKKIKILKTTLRFQNHFFTMKRQQNQQKLNWKQLMKTICQNVNVKDNYKVQINFQQFKKLFYNQLPGIFIDLLYVLGNLQSPDQKYTNLDISFLQKKQQKQKIIHQKQFKIEVYLNTVKQIKQNYQQLEIVNY